jgi:hypothetical protein
VSTSREFRLAGPEDGLPCTNCGVVRSRADLDRLLWCAGCIQASRDRALRLGWGIGVGVALVAALWIWVFAEPTQLVWGGWAASIVALLWLGARFGREIVYGVYRARGGPKAPDALPGWEGPQPGLR